MHRGFCKSILIQSRQLLIYLIYFLTELARYAETDSLRRSSKHLPTELDKNVNTKLAGNQLTLENAGTGILSENGEER